MSDSEMINRRCLVILLLLFSACTGSRWIVTTEPPSPQWTSPVLSQTVTIFLPTPEGCRDRSWYGVKGRQWTLKEEPTTLVREALAVELEAMGAVVKDTCHGCSGRLHAEVRWFAPDGGYPLSAGLIVSLSLYRAEGKTPIWRGKIHGGCSLAGDPLLASDIPGLMGEAISEALKDAAKELRWRPGFLDALNAL